MSVLLAFVGGIALGTVLTVAAYSRLVRTLKEATPAKALGYAPECRAQTDGYSCSRQSGHPGDHVARLNHVQGVVAVWR